PALRARRMTRWRHAPPAPRTRLLRDPAQGDHLRCGDPARRARPPGDREAELPRPLVAARRRRRCGRGRPAVRPAGGVRGARPPRRGGAAAERRLAPLERGAQRPDGGALPLRRRRDPAGRARGDRGAGGRRARGLGADPGVRGASALPLGCGADAAGPRGAARRGGTGPGALVAALTVSTPGRWAPRSLCNLPLLLTLTRSGGVRSAPRPARV